MGRKEDAMRNLRVGKIGLERNRVRHDPLLVAIHGVVAQRDALAAALQRFVAFHQGHVLPPELAGIMEQSRKALEMGGRKEAP